MLLTSTPHVAARNNAHIAVLAISKYMRKLCTCPCRLNMWMCARNTTMGQYPFRNASGIAAQIKGPSNYLFSIFTKPLLRKNSRVGIWASDPKKNVATRFIAFLSRLHNKHFCFCYNNQRIFVPSIFPPIFPFSACCISVAFNSRSVPGRDILVDAY